MLLKSINDDEIQQILHIMSTLEEDEPMRDRNIMIL